MIRNVIPDIPRIYTAIAECLSCVMMVMLIKPKITKTRLALYTALYLVILMAFMQITANVVIWLWIPCMIVAFFLMSAFVRISCKTSLYKSIYYAILAFSVAELIASVEWQIVNFIFSDARSIPWYFEIGLLIAVYGILSFCQYKIFKPRMEVLGKLDMRQGDWLSAIFIAIAVFAFSNIRFITDGIIMGEYSREIASARTLVDIAGVSFLYAHCVSCCNNAVVRELDAVHQTLQTQYQQYKLSRESIDVINMKYHDLKHQINYLRDEQDPQKRNEFLDRIENDIKSFEVQNKTGNAVLDTILTGKSLYCIKHGITLTIVADGKLIDFMNVVDICSIFGNALDNAIESVMRIKDKEKRLIHVTVSSVNDFVMIRIENYFEGELMTDGSDYISTKNDKKFHGYGIKSIKYTADKYDGAVYINTEDNWFDIKIAIPRSAS